MVGRAEPPELRGIIPNSFEHIFEYIKATAAKEFLVRCSYLEIYNEEIRDLLGSDATAKMELREDPDKGVFVDGLTQARTGGGGCRHCSLLLVPRRCCLPAPLPLPPHCPPADRRGLGGRDRRRADARQQVPHGGRDCDERGVVPVALHLHDRH